MNRSAGGIIFVNSSRLNTDRRVLVSGGNILQNARIGEVECVQHVPSSFNVAGVSGAAGQSYSDSERVQSVSGNNLGPPALLQFAKTRKLSMERSDPRKYVLVCFLCSFSMLLIHSKAVPW